ncbi:hypothetical protein CXB49_00095 [Chromobacterium sp. ATCC 53434]|uniref:transposase n=1 Tax=Chromobacterium sp. (strain ATCC 53434 / SC 14030) TaxID=2059672 RepID=UPI000C77B85C|nr:transposase [Chromobacterium sp. ATCC 53434]AUH49357.1 hypothetical protein CXB49_00095 [Chromobacterium sp. ATCC 53434]
MAVTKRQTQYTPEFRAEAVKLVVVQGLSLHEAAERLKISKGTLGYWVTMARKSTAPSAAAAGGLKKV